MADSPGMPPPDASDGSAHPDESVRLRLFGGFALCRSAESVRLPPALQRLLALPSLRVAVTPEQAGGIRCPEVAVPDGTQSDITRTSPDRHRFLGAEHGHDAPFDDGHLPR
jgi:hypothetical protein